VVRRFGDVDDLFAAGSKLRVPRLNEIDANHVVGVRIEREDWNSDLRNIDRLRIQHEIHQRRHSFASIPRRPELGLRRIGWLEAVVVASDQSREPRPKWTGDESASPIRGFVVGRDEHERHGRRRVAGFARELHRQECAGARPDDDDLVAKLFPDRERFARVVDPLLRRDRSERFTVRQSMRGEPREEHVCAE